MSSARLRCNKSKAIQAPLRYGLAFISARCPAVLLTSAHGICCFLIYFFSGNNIYTLPLLCSPAGQHQTRPAAPLTGRYSWAAGASARRTASQFRVRHGCGKTLLTLTAPKSFHHIAEHMQLACSIFLKTK